MPSCPHGPGELARVAVLRRHLPGHGRGTTATLFGTVFAHRLFDLPAVALLVAYVFATAKIPHWAVTSLIVIGLIAIALLSIALVSVRRAHGAAHALDSRVSSVRRLLVMARQGLAVLRAPVSAAGAALFQIAGWLLQLLAVWAVMEAFNLDLPLPAAALVLLLVNVATIFPFWPGNVGLLQAAVALPLTQYGVAYGTGFAYALALQAVEMSVGVGVGSSFLPAKGCRWTRCRPWRTRKMLPSKRWSPRSSSARMPRAPTSSARASKGSIELLRQDGSAVGRELCVRALTMFGSNEPRRAAITSSAVARAGSWPVTAATNSSRSRASSTTSVAAVTVAVRGTSRSNAISPKPSPRRSRRSTTSTSPSAIT